jgi:hypothetical protein
MLKKSNIKFVLNLPEILHYISLNPLAYFDESVTSVSLSDFNNILDCEMSPDGSRNSSVIGQ